MPPTNGSDGTPWWETCKIVPSGLEIPAKSGDVDESYMTTLLKARGVIGDDNEVVSMTSSGVGDTAGYFSDIKFITCVFKVDTGAPTKYVVKAWPPFELLPKEAIAGMFIKDIDAYHHNQSSGFPRAKAFLAAFDLATFRFCLILENVNTFGQHMDQLKGIDLAGVKKMIPKMASVAAAWEGCDKGGLSEALDAVHVNHWCSPANLGVYKALMPQNCRYSDKYIRLDCPMMDDVDYVGLAGPTPAEDLTCRLESVFSKIDPKYGGTCTLVHGDCRGDNLFFCEKSEDYPDGWLLIDFQLMFRGPVPSDLAFLLCTGSVKEEVYHSKETLDELLDLFYTEFKAKTKIYTSYTYEQFVLEFKTMLLVYTCYNIAMAGPLYQAALQNQQLILEFYEIPISEDELPEADQRKRKLIKKYIHNFPIILSHYGVFDYIRSLPKDSEELQIADPPERLLSLPEKSTKSQAKPKPTRKIVLV